MDDLRPVLPMYAIFSDPLDYPGRFVARRFMVMQVSALGAAVVPQQVIAIGRTLDEVRAALPPGLAMVTRSPDDDPAIVETWF